MKSNYMIIGRVPEDDEDTCMCFEGVTLEEAEGRFAEAMTKDLDGNWLAYIKKRYDAESGVYILHAFRSDSPIVQEF